MTRIFRYILVDDVGMAPCPAQGLITLATCKPQIRRSARPGDWVLGFRPGSLERGMCLWAGCVERSMSHGDYERTYRGRPDAVYRESSNGSYSRVVPDYHPGQAAMDTDLSAPVLIFQKKMSVYFEGQPKPLPRELMHLAAAGRGHRVNGTLPGDVARLQSWLVDVASEAPTERPAKNASPKRRGCSAPHSG